MQQLKINNTSTPYWWVEVPVDAEDFYVDNENESLEYLLSDGKIKYEGGHYLEDGNWELLGCITLEGMDDGVKEVVNYCNDFTGLPVHQAFYEGAMSALLVHNQLTLTADKKAVVLKQIN